MNKKIIKILDTIKEQVDVIKLVDLMDKLNMMDDEDLDYILSVIEGAPEMINEEWKRVSSTLTEEEVERWNNSYNREVYDTPQLELECPYCHNKKYIINETGYICEVCGKTFLADLC